MSQAQLQTIPKLVIRKVIRAKRERVFEAWTKPELMQQWLVPPEDWTAEAKADPRIGGKYEVVMIVGNSADVCVPGYTPGQRLMHQGEYLEIKPPEKIVFSWNTHLVQNTRVTIELKDLGDSTEVWLTHELLPNEEMVKAHEGGWNGCMVKLEKLLTQ